MAYKFYCTNCGANIIAERVKIGETVKCGSCGAENVVPSDALEVDGQPSDSRPAVSGKYQSDGNSENLSSKPVPSFSEALSMTWQTIKNNSNVSLLTAIIILVFSLSSNSIQFMINYRVHDYNVYFHPFFLVNWIINFFISIGLLNIALSYAYDKTAIISNFTTTMNKYLKTFVAGLLFALILYIGFILLIIPGIIILLRYQYCTLFILKYDTGIIDSFKLSAKLTEGNRMDLFVFGIVSILFGLLGVIACGIGIYVTYPIAIACWVYTFYRLIQAKKFEDKISGPGLSTYTENA